MRCEEIVAVALPGVHVAHHHKEASVLKVEVGIDIHHRIVAHFCAAVAFLHGELSESRTVVGCVILGEVACVGSEITFQHFCNLKPKIDVGVDRCSTTSDR